MELGSILNNVVAAGYPYELAGLVFYLFFLSMTRRQSAGRYSQRTRVLTIAAAIGLVGVVPFHYANNAAAVGVAIALAAGALGSAFFDARAAAKRS